MDRAEIENRFTYHPPFGTQTERYEEIRNTAREIGLRLEELCPDSRELSLALNHLDQMVMFANAAIARNEEPQ